MAGKLPSLEFAVAAASLKLEPAAIEAARRVLVDGEAQTEVAASMQATKQSVNYWVKRVADMHEAQAAALLAVAPAGWEIEIVMAPASRMEKIRAMAEAERQLHIAGEGGSHD